MNHIVRIKNPSGHTHEVLYCECCKCYKAPTEFSLVKSRVYLDSKKHDYPTVCIACNELSLRIEAHKAFIRAGRVTINMSKDIAREFEQLEKVLEGFPLMEPIVMRGIIDEVYGWVNERDEENL
jgi:hypothetical protein